MDTKFNVILKCTISLDCARLVDVHTLSSQEWHHFFLSTFPASFSYSAAAASLLAALEGPVLPLASKLLKKLASTASFPSPPWGEWGGEEKGEERGEGRGGEERCRERSGDWERGEGRGDGERGVCLA